VRGKADGARWHHTHCDLDVAHDPITESTTGQPGCESGTFATSAHSTLSYHAVITQRTCVTVHGGALQLCSKVVSSVAAGRGPFFTLWPKVFIPGVTGTAAWTAAVAASAASRVSRRVGAVMAARGGGCLDR